MLFHINQKSQPISIYDFKLQIFSKKWEEKKKGFLWSSIKKKRGTYFPISNIKLGLGDNQKTLDFKIGKKTAFKSDKGAIGRFRHKILDEEMSRSSEIGFRLEGATEVNGMVEKAKKEDTSYLETFRAETGSEKVDFQI